MPLSRHLLLFPILLKWALGSSCLWAFIIHHCHWMRERDSHRDICTFSSNFSLHISHSISITIILISYHRHDHGHEQLKQLRSLGTLPKRAAAAFDIIVVNPVVNIITRVIILPSSSSSCCYHQHHQYHLPLLLIIMSIRIITAILAKRFSSKQKQGRCRITSC